MRVLLSHENARVPEHLAHFFERPPMPPPTRDKRARSNQARPDIPGTLDERPGSFVLVGSRGARYRKVAPVLAFLSADSFAVKKAWGDQKLLEESWLIVPLSGGKPTTDIYGCGADAFARSYRPHPSVAPNMFEKFAEVLAYQPGVAFAVRTVENGHVEVERSVGGESDWIVRNEGGEVYPVTDSLFRESYRLVSSAPPGCMR
jgi:hypothetical protein